MITYGSEAPAEAGAREALLDRIMGRERLLKPSERLRRGRQPAGGLSLVARDGGSLVGSVRLWHVAAGGVPALLLGPLAVETRFRRIGVGANLMRLALGRATELGHGGVILIGDRDYYERFGFSAEPTSDLVMPAPVDRHRFLALELAPRALDGASGLVVASGEHLVLSERIAA